MCLTHGHPMNYSMPGFPVLQYLQSLLKLMSIESVMPSNHLILLPTSPLALDLSQHQGLFQWVSSSHQVAKVLKLQLQHQSFQWIFRTDFLSDGLVGSPCSPRDSQKSSTPQFKSINSLVLSFLYGSTYTSIHDYWKKHIFDYLNFWRQSNVSAFYILSRLVMAFLPRSKHLWWREKSI